MNTAIDDKRIIIIEAVDSLTIIAGAERWYFSRDDLKEDLVGLFKYLGFTDVEYEMED